MSNDISKYVEQIVSKISGDDSLISQFKENPTKVVTNLLGIDLDSNILQNVISAVTTKLNLEGVAKNASGFLAKLKALFGIK